MLKKNNENNLKVCNFCVADGIVQAKSASQTKVKTYIYINPKQVYTNILHEDRVVLLEGERQEDKNILDEWGLYNYETFSKDYIDHGEFIEGFVYLCELTLGTEQSNHPLDPIEYDLTIYVTILDRFTLREYLSDLNLK